MKKDRERNGITGGLLLIGLAILIYTNQWWPGIMIVLGIAIGSGLVYRKEYMTALITSIIFFGIPIITETKTLPWNVFVPIVLAGLGIMILAKELRQKKTENGK